MQDKQRQMDTMARKLDDATAELERIREDKDEEIQILEESVNATLKQMQELHQVCLPRRILQDDANHLADPRGRGSNYRCSVDHAYPQQPERPQ